MSKLLLVGTGGHCRSILDSLVDTNEYSEIGLITKEKANIKELYGIKIIGCDSDLQSLYNDGWKNAFVCVGSVEDNSIRKNLVELLNSIGFIIPNIIDSTSIIAKDVLIGKGNYIGKNTTINIGSKIGNYNIINTSSVVEHECVIGSFSHIGTNSTLCGNVIVGDDCLIGAGSCVKQEIEIGNNTVIGLGSVVTKNIDSNKIAYGVPCKVIKEKH